jgi:hypothetical protein
LTIAATGDPDALASALEVFQSKALPDRQFSYRQLKESVASHSHNLLLKERIVRLREGPNRTGRDNQVGLWLTLLAVVFVCYRVV